MNRFLQSNVILLVGAAVALALMAVRGASSDKALRRDLRGAIWFFLCFMVLRALGWALDEHASRGWLQAMRVGWMVAFAFGGVRTVVSLALWAWRLRSRQPTPKIFRDVLDVTLYVLTIVPILRSQLEVDLTGLLATSAILSVVLGLALQDTLGNLFSGLSLQLERPFQVGDWVSIGQHIGQVAQVGWRATRIENFRRESITLPNNIVSKEPVKNFSREVALLGIDIPVNAGPLHPPNEVKRAVLETLAEMPKVLPDPAPHCRLVRYGDSGLEYTVRCFIQGFADREDVIEEFLSRLWYRFRRDGIGLAFPQRVVHSAPATALPVPGPTVALGDTARAEVLHAVELFHSLPPAEIERVARDATLRLFGRGERILEEGEPGQTFFVIAQGRVSVRAGKPEREVTQLGRGEHFGEMSLLTGEPRFAAVVALEDVLLLEFDRATFARLFEDNPGLDRQLSALLAHRRAEIRARAEAPGAATAPDTDVTPEAGRILGRLKSIFG